MECFLLLGACAFSSNLITMSSFKILADLVVRGSEIFNHGYQLINLCWSAGLIPKLEVSRLDDPQVIVYLWFCVVIAAAYLLPCEGVTLLLTILVIEFGQI